MRGQTAFEKIYLLNALEPELEATVAFSVITLGATTSGSST